MYILRTCVHVYDTYMHVQMHIDLPDLAEPARAGDIAHMHAYTHTHTHTNTHIQMRIDLLHLAVRAGAGDIAGRVNGLCHRPVGRQVARIDHFVSRSLRLLIDLFLLQGLVVDVYLLFQLLPLLVRGVLLILVCALTLEFLVVFPGYFKLTL